MAPVAMAGNECPSLAVTIEAAAVVDVAVDRHYVR
jgi:hypothetical protein